MKGCGWEEKGDAPRPQLQEESWKSCGRKPPDAPHRPKRPMGTAKGKQSDTEALCQPPPRKTITIGVYCCRHHHEMITTQYSPLSVPCPILQQQKASLACFITHPTCMIRRTTGGRFPSGNGGSQIRPICGRPASEPHVRCSRPAFPIRRGAAHVSMPFRSHQLHNGVKVSSGREIPHVVQQHHQLLPRQLPGVAQAGRGKHLRSSAVFRAEEDRGSVPFRRERLLLPDPRFRQQMPKRMTHCCIQILFFVHPPVPSPAPLRIAGSGSVAKPGSIMVWGCCRTVRARSAHRSRVLGCLPRDYPVERPSQKHTSKPHTHTQKCLETTSPYTIYTIHYENKKLARGAHGARKVQARPPLTCWSVRGGFTQRAPNSEWRSEQPSGHAFRATHLRTDAVLSYHQLSESLLSRYSVHKDLTMSMSSAYTLIPAPIALSSLPSFSPACIVALGHNFQNFRCNANRITTPGACPAVRAKPRAWHTSARARIVLGGSPALMPMFVLPLFKAGKP